MESREEADGTLIVSHDSRRLALFLFTLGALFLATLAYDLTLGTRGTQRAMGLVGAAATCLLSGLMFFESARFAFDARRRRIDWRRRFAFSRRAGSLLFEEIRDVAIETPIGDDGVPSRRIAFKLADGSALPMSAGFSPDHGDVTLALAGRIRTVLGIAPDHDGSRALAALVAAGRTVEAAKLLIQTKGLSLEQAMQQIQAMKRSE